MADNNLNKAYQEALKKIDNMVKKQESLKKSTESLANSWNAISSELFKMDGAQFFKNVEKTPEQLKAMGKEVSDMEESFKNLGNDFAKTLGNDNKFKLVQKQLRGIGKAFEDTTSKTNALIKSSFNEIYGALDSDLKKIINSEEDLEKILKNKESLTKDQLESLKKIDKFRDLEKKHDDLSIDYQKELSAKLESYKKTMPILATMNQDIVAEMMSQIAAGKSIEELMISEGEEQKAVLAALSSSSVELNKINKGMTAAAEQVSIIRKEATEMNKQFSLGQGLLGALKSAGSGFASIITKGWIGALTQFDETLNKVQKETGVNLDRNKDGFAKLQTQVAQYGMSIEDAGKMIGDMSKELNTTNFSVLSKAAADFAAIEGATGAASSDITNIAGELMRMGESSEQVKDFMQGADSEARKFGVSSSKVLGGISKNIKKMREMGFTGGEKSLTKMAVTAERLRMNMDETFDMAKRARSIEGAMDMAAELQLAGGSFANINPMDLLSAARKGPAELQKILTTMGKDIGRFDKETGKFQFDPVDVDRLQMVSDATGQSMESLQNMIEKNAEDTEKLNPFQGMIDGLDEADKDLAKSALSDMMKRGKNGKMEIDVDNDMAKKMGITDLAKITPEIMNDILEGKKEDALSLDLQNKRNQSMKKSFDNFINSLMSIFSVFQPVLEILTSVMQTVTEVFTGIWGFIGKLGLFGTVLKWGIGALLLFGTSFGASVLTFVSKGLGGFKDMFSGKSGILGKLTGAGKAGGGATDIAAGAKGPSPMVGGGLKSLAEGLKAMGSDSSVFKGIGAVALAGPAFLLFVPALPGLLILGLIGTIGKQVTQGFTAIAQGLISFGSDSAIFKGIGALMLAVIPLAIFGPTSLLLLPLAIIGALGPLIELGFKTISSGIGIMGNNLANIAKGVLAMVLVAAGVGAFAFVASMMTDIDWMNVLKGIGVMALVTLGLIGLGFLLSGPGIVFLAIGAAALIGVGLALAIAGAGLLVAAEAFKQLGSVDWGAFAEMGGALLSVVPGLLGFSLAAMLFMNPLTLLGIMFMTMALAGLASVMVPLAASLDLGASSLDKFASGLEKLGAAADKLSLEKLEKLKELSDAMASASAGGAAMSAMANVIGGGAGGGGAEKTVKVEVDLKLNGKQIQTILASGKVDSTHNV